MSDLPAGASTAFGPLFLSVEFDQQVTAFVKRWIDTHLSEVELRLGHQRRTVDRPRSYTRATAVEHGPGAPPPGTLVAPAGFLAPPTRLGGGQYAGWWVWVAAVILTGRDYESTRLKTS